MISSFGNPILFGSYLVMSIVITLGLTLDRARGDNRWWLPLMALLIGIQFTAIWFTGSRGTWVGITFGISAFVLLGYLSFSGSQMVRVVSVLGAGLLIAVLVTNSAGEPNAGSARSLDSILSGTTPVLGGVGGRSDIWQGSFRLLDSWERPHTDPGIVSVFRPIVGLGPEMFYYSYPLVANPQNEIILVSHAHSFPLQLLLERGLAGLATFLILAVCVLITGVSLIRSRRQSVDRQHSWLLIATIAVLAALIGRAAEQIVGIARIGDLVPFWVLLGVMLAIYGMANRSTPEASEATESRPVSGTRFPYLRFVLGTIVALVAIGTFVARDVQMLRAGLIAGDAYAEGRAGNTTEAVAMLERAIDLAPDVQDYRVQAGELLGLEARAQSTSEEALALFEEAYETFAGYEQRDPSAFVTQLRLSNTDAEFVKFGRDDRLFDLIERTYRVAVALPAYPAIQALAAQRLLVAGQYELGLELAEKAIAMEPETSPQPLAWLQRGLALGEQGNVEGALESFMSGLELEPGGKHAPSIHRAAALAYEALGDPESASEHLALAVEIQATLTN